MKIILCILLLFAALGIACAVWIGRRRASPPADPFASPFGEMPTIGFTAEQLRRIAPDLRYRDPLRRSFATRPMPPIVGDHTMMNSAGPALRPSDADGGGRSVPSWFAPISNFLKGRRHG